MNELTQFSTSPELPNPDVLDGLYDRMDADELILRTSNMNADQFFDRVAATEEYGEAFGDIDFESYGNIINSLSPVPSPFNGPPPASDNNGQLVSIPLVFENIEQYAVDAIPPPPLELDNYPANDINNNRPSDDNHVANDAIPPPSLELDNYVANDINNNGPSDDNDAANNTIPPPSLELDNYVANDVNNNGYSDNNDQLIIPPPPLPLEFEETNNNVANNVNNNGYSDNNDQLMIPPLPLEPEETNHAQDLILDNTNNKEIYHAQDLVLSNANNTNLNGITYISSCNTFVNTMHIHLSYNNIIINYISSFVNIIYTKSDTMKNESINPMPLSIYNTNNIPPNTMTIHKAQGQTLNHPMPLSIYDTTNTANNIPPNTNNIPPNTNNIPSNTTTTSVKRFRVTQKEPGFKVDRKKKSKRKVSNNIESNYHFEWNQEVFPIGKKQYLIKGKLETLFHCKKKGCRRPDGIRQRKRHILEMKHPEERAFYVRLGLVCSGCDKIFTTAYAKRQHTEVQCKEYQLRPYECSVCYRRYRLSHNCNKNKK